MQKKFFIAVCDKNTEDTDILIDIIKNSGLHCETDHYISAESLLAEPQIDKYDLFILEIFLGGMSGLSLARKIREINKECEIVFATASEEFALDAFEVNALQYLVKPLKPNDMSRMLNQFIQTVKRRSLI